MNNLKLKISKWNKNWKIISLFVFFTFSIWLILQLSKSYTYHFPITLQIADLPVEIDLQKSKVDLEFELTGFQLLAKLQSNTLLKIPASSVIIKDSVVVLPEKQMIEETKKLLDLPPNSTVSLLTEELPLIRRNKKVIDLRFQNQIKFKGQYNSLRGPFYDTRQIEVTAPNFILDTLSSLKVEPLKFNQLGQDKAGSLQILNPNVDLIILSQTEVEYQIEVQEFTEKEIILPFQVINLPVDYSLITFPENVQLKFQVPLEDFSSSSFLDFEVIVDFDERLEEESLLIPQLKSYPNFIIHPSIQPKTIDYLIKYKNE